MVYTIYSTVLQIPEQNDQYTIKWVGRDLGMQLGRIEKNSKYTLYFKSINIVKFDILTHVYSHPVSASGSKVGRPCCSLPCSRRWCSWSCRSFACGWVEGGVRGETGCGSCPPQMVRLPQKKFFFKRQRCTDISFTTAFFFFKQNAFNYYVNFKKEQGLICSKPATCVFWMVNLGHCYQMSVNQLLEGTKKHQYDLDGKRGRKRDVERWKDPMENTCRSSSAMKKEGALALGCM